MTDIAKKNGRTFRAIYSLAFFLALTISFPAYINSTFLEQYISESMVGILYTIGSILTLVVLINMPRIVRRFHNYHVTIALGILQILFLFTLAFSKNIYLLVIAFSCYLAVMSALWFTIDLFLENYSQNKSTGEIRGAYLTITNIAWIVSPLAVGTILSDSNYWRIYTIAALCIIPVMFLAYFRLRSFRDPNYETIPFFSAIKQSWKNKNIFKIFSIEFLLRFFYSWMVIYMPLYLHNHVGFEWQEIGAIFTIMLLPFILFETPVGTLADKKWGEKEFLSIGIAIISISTVAIYFIDSTNFLVWTALLFVTRIGASIIEIMDESYFFKQIDGTDASLLEVFRNTHSLAYIISPIVAMIVLSLFGNDYRYLFLALGLIMATGLFQSLTLKDTK
ncbi:MAG: hypothetical protein COZ49_01620 [Candidatus Yonathbacteria bacterium CG_4_10_14_3_um_filter_47_65]|uniref:Major facilitator superfamily (MFS) profile domain-containing protein n=2 Tax=Parcubacteria group TaxID=1794811 RepID=A0A2M8D5R3_9BACT|nr:MAG: hypothetical protein AUJ44_02225 [Candidatus Nomurabacteria bacterium CG1_02_47_685]PIP03312.1 MAG: hypothetical protein COX54_04160 [Candidatus Yonathbacteria bacterium CG23_combo_of_CG06-09_8_20_14_all_46_18]PIQ32050.1 MAG: hypothetical protein COW61_02555 [Candidatus Yonathbacteria bacterium CG17_big_fil_post_rev_8_21_14_2_50_46_19]PIX56538.1 MAG: hypothetical protein COZ49_01620 [Candidatus Yonathbacteria bacterium CG_4_10_14_3_um_filter_47_65]PIY58042.1 MAG: hypothetical protein CO